MTYFRLFRVGEVTNSEHTIKACDVHLGTNKNKVLFALQSSKTHGKNMTPWLIKIASTKKYKHDQDFYYFLIKNENFLCSWIGCL